MKLNVFILALGLCLFAFGFAEAESISSGNTVASQDFMARNELNSYDQIESYNHGRESQLRQFSAQNERIPKTGDRSSDTSRIIGGYKAPYNTYSHIAHITILTRNSTARCTGSILDSRRVLSAAHCFTRYPLSYVYVTIGSTALKGRAYRVESIHIHFNYSSYYFRNDVAILTIDGTFKPPFRPVVLPSPGFKFTPRMYVYAAGVGYTRNWGRRSNRVLEVRLRYQSYWVCIKQLDPVLRSFISPKEVICATDPRFPRIGEKGVCYGDSGAPLFRKQGNKILQLGIASFSQVPCVSKGGTQWFDKLPSNVRAINAFLKRGDSTVWYRIF